MPRSMQKPPPLSAFLHPRFWPTWTGIFLLMIAARLPFFLRLLIGESLGMLTYRFGRERRYITTVNIDLCFPERDARERRQLVRQSFRENGIGLIETASAWFDKPGAFANRTTVTGLDKLEDAQRQGRGILLIGAHYSTLDLGANLLAPHHAFAATYRPHNNALFDAFMLRGRLKNCSRVFDRDDIRGAFRHLKQGGTLWYAPDQDYGPRHAVFAPFFGKPAATITAAARFAAFNRSPVFLIRHHRVGRSNRYELEFTPFPDTFPAGNDVADATVVNTLVESAIRHYPAQYLWMHKRFKTQPGGKPQSPYIDIATPNHRLSEQQYRQMLAGARQLGASADVTDYSLANGLRLRQYPGLVGKRFYQRHPAKDFDRHAKTLRMHAIPCITVDNFFRIETQQISAVTYFAPPGQPLSQPWPVTALATFLARLHDRGFLWEQPAAAHLLADGDTIAVVDPTTFIHWQALSGDDRQAALAAVASNLQLDAAQSRALFSAYAQAAGLPAFASQGA